MSDAAFLKHTGHGLDHWFAVLDRFGAVEKGHTASARHLHETHGVDGWYAQGITVSYERERGVRAVNQRLNGQFEVSVSKTMNATTKQVVKAFSDARTRATWINEADAKLADALAKGVADKKSKGFVIRPDGLGRFRYKWNDTTVQLYLTPKSKEKISVVVTQMKLPSGRLGRSAATTVEDGARPARRSLQRLKEKPVRRAHERQPLCGGAPTRHRRKGLRIIVIALVAIEEVRRSACGRRRSTGASACRRHRLARSRPSNRARSRPACA